MASKLEYLTIQDILWINLQVTKSVHRYDYATLEEAVFYQYAYGDSHDLLSQAARFLTGFLGKAPIASGNEATAFVASAAFLRINGMQLTISEAESRPWFQRARSSISAAREALSESVEKISDWHPPVRADVRAAVLDVMVAYSGTVSELSGVPFVLETDAAIH